MAESVSKNHSDFDSVCGCGDLHTPCVRVRYLTPTRHNSNHLEYIHAQKKKKKKKNHKLLRDLIFYRKRQKMNTFISKNKQINLVC